jgi:putative phosphoribosyl transferase
MVRFADRRDAGQRLATRLARFRDRRPVVVGMPRGGVPVAAEVAWALGAPLEVAVVRKVGAPRNREFAIGAVAEGGVRMLSAGTVRALGLSERGVAALTARAERELAEQVRCYRGQRAPPPLAGRTVILVDDGLATGRSARAAIASVRARGAVRVVLAVPVAARESVRELRAEADEVVCVEMPPELWAVGCWYEDFAPASDAQVAALLAAHSGQ